MTLTDADLARLEALDKAATAGPWRIGWQDDADYWVAFASVSGEAAPGSATITTPNDSASNEEADVALVVESRNLLPSLVAELREARAEVARLRVAVLEVGAKATDEIRAHGADMERLTIEAMAKYADNLMETLISPLIQERDEARAALARVKALHFPRPSWTPGSTARICGYCERPYPCQTIRAIEGASGE